MCSCHAYHVHKCTYRIWVAFSDFNSTEINVSFIEFHIASHGRDIPRAVTYTQHIQLHRHAPKYVYIYIPVQNEMANHEVYRREHIFMCNILGFCFIWCRYVAKATIFTYLCIHDVYCLYIYKCINEQKRFIFLPSAWTRKTVKNFIHFHKTFADCSITLCWFGSITWLFRASNRIGFAFN